MQQPSTHTSEQISARDNAMHIMNNDTRFHANTTVRGPPRCKTFFPLCVVRYKRRCSILPMKDGPYRFEMLQMCLIISQCWQMPGL